MAEKNFGVKVVNMIGVGTPAIRSDGVLTIRTGTGTSDAIHVSTAGTITNPSLSQPMASMYNTGAAGLSVPANTDTKITYNTVDFVQGGMLVSLTNNRITVPVSGKYYTAAAIGASNVTVSSGDGWRFVAKVNGTTYGNAYYWPIQTTGSAAGDEFSISYATILNLTAGDYVETWFTSVNTAAATVNYGHMCMHLLG